MKNAVSLVRVSTLRQENDRQHSDINDYVQREGLNLVKTFEEKISGTKKIKQRKELQRMLEFVINNDIQYLIVSEISRLGRTSEVIPIIEDLNERKICTVFLKDGLKTLTKDGLIDTSTMLVLGILSSIAINELTTLKYRVKGGLKQGVKDGNVGGGNSIPYGYMKLTNESNPKIKTLSVNPVLVDVVRMIFEMSLSTGTKNIAKYLNQKGITSKGGGKWFDASIYRMLKNPVYIGKRRFNDGTKNEKDKYNYMFIDAPAIVDEEIFNQVQNRLSNRDNKQGINKRYESLFDKKKIICGVCGKHYAVKRVIGKRVQPIYQCSSNRNPETKCGNRSIGLDKFERVITEYLLKNFHTNIISRINTDEFDEKIKTQNFHIDEIKGFLKKEKQRENNYIEMRADGEINKVKFLEMVNPVRKDISTLEQKIDEVTTEINRLVELKKNKTDLQVISETIKKNGMDRDMIRNIITNIYIYPEREYKLSGWKNDNVFRVVLVINEMLLTLLISQRTDNILTDYFCDDKGLKFLSIDNHPELEEISKNWKYPEISNKHLAV